MLCPKRQWVFCSSLIINLVIYNLLIEFYSYWKDDDNMIMCRWEPLYLYSLVISRCSHSNQILPRTWVILMVNGENRCFVVCVCYVVAGFSDFNNTHAMLMLQIFIRFDFSDSLEKRRIMWKGAWKMQKRCLLGSLTGWDVPSG